MKAEIIRANPAGNITLFVTSDYPGKRGEIAAELMAQKQWQAEQVGFLAHPKLGAQARLEMMGGEFCGNAARSAALIALRMQGKSSGEITIECSGCDHVLHAECGRDWSAIEMPLPFEIIQTEVNGFHAVLVVFEGIEHMVIRAGKPDEKTVHAVLDKVIGERHAEAAGALFYDRAGRRMTPVVYVKATDTLVYESSCASGTAAVIAAETAELPDGRYEVTLQEPGGVLTAEAVKENGKVTGIRLGGRVEIEAPCTVEL